MYRLVIADDEFTIRSGLFRMIDWQSMGFKLTGCFEDGKDIISYVENHEVDVIFTDVEMYTVSGLEVARWIAENHPNVIVVIISGYKEFDYVKEALTVNVFDYILKPIDPDEIVRVFSKVKDKLDKENSKIKFSVEESMLLLSPEQSVERAKVYIKDHIAEELTVEKIAQSVYLSRSYFAREFKRCTGVSVMDYVIGKRMELAIEMIRNGEKSQKKIAACVGYSELKYFQSSFKKHTGYTVKEYMRLLHI